MGLPLNIPLGFATEFPTKNSPYLMYEELSSVWNKVVEQNKNISTQEKEKFRRVLLLGHAFRNECNPLAEKLYNTWLFGPNNVSFKSMRKEQDSKMMLGDFGLGLQFFNSAERPWFKINWNEIINSKTVKEFKATSLEVGKQMISSKDFSVEFKNELKKEYIDKEIGYKGSFGDISTNSLNKPNYVLLTPVLAKEKFGRNLSVQTLDQMLKERDLGTAFLIGQNSLSTLLVLFLAKEMMLDQYTKNKMPDIISSLGSFGMYVYTKGDLEIVNSTLPGKKKAKFTFKYLGTRIVDSYDFEGWQPLGCWYPEKGHDLSTVKFAFDMSNDGIGSQISSALATFTSCTLMNSDFRNFKEKIKEPFNSLSPNYKLSCDDYYVVTPMILDKLDSLPDYEIDF
ncbi:MAG: DUF6402 family protein [Flavobacterium sp.]|uniref:DUF6402 family protein n=1 Tax=Flavobacterium sp. TaxID=239 RepID=UPI00326796FD